MNMAHSHNMNLAHSSNSQVDRHIEREDDPMEIDSSHNDISSSSNNMPNIPMLSQTFSRSSSEPIHYMANVDNQADSLLQDWPRRTSSYTPINTQDWASLCKNLEDTPPQHPRAVTFSERSSMHVYRPDPNYIRSKAYSREERKSFGTDAMMEAIRIKRLVLSTPGESTKESFKYLLKNHVICLEEIVGIEHLVLGRSASKLLKERQDHAKAVLMEQCKQRVGAKIQDDTTQKLGEFSASRSCKSVKRARIRAAMAA